MALFYKNWSQEKPILAMPGYLNSVGKNSLLIYLFFETVVPQWLNKTTHIFVGGFAHLVSMPEAWGDVLTSIVVLMIIVRLATWLDEQKIYFKI
jgi:hypothetical protein